MIPNEGIVPEYLHYNLSRRYIEIRNLTGDLDRSGLNLHIVGRISVPIPSLNEQRGIVEVLSCFDLAFKKTGEVIAKTERLKKGLMQQLLTKGIGHKEYKYNMELGFEIPSEWSVKPTKELFYIKGRIGWRGLKRADFITEGPYLVTGVDFSDGRIVWRNCVHIPMSKFLESPEIFVQKDDILMTKDGTIGKVAYVDYVPGGKASINAHLFLIRTLRNINIHPMYIYYALQTSHFLKYATLRQVGTTRAGFSQRAFEKFPFLLPSYEEQKKIVDILSSTDKKLELEKQEKAKLERVKSSLMDLLLSGKVRVRAD
jgi:type I restriction enzyme S subunit